MRVAVVSEFYPRRRDPVLGIWAHRQALAAQAAGAEIAGRRAAPGGAAAVEPAGRTPRGHRRRRRAARAALARRRSTACRSPTCRSCRPCARAPTPPGAHGPPRRCAWRCTACAGASRFDLVHAHNAIPAADAVRRTRRDVPLVVSVHGGDVLYTAPGSRAGDAAVRRALGAARLVAGQQRRDRRAGPPPRGRGDAGRAPRHRRARAHGGAQRDARRSSRSAHLVARKRHADVLRAVAVLSARHPTLRYQIIGDGPERAALARARRAPADRRPRQLPRPARPRGGARDRAPRDAVRDAEHRGGVRRRLRRGDGGRPAGDRLPRRARPGGDRRGRRRLRARATRRHRAAHAADRRAAVGPAPAARGRPARSCDGRSRTSPGGVAARRRSPPTSTPCDEAGPVRHRARTPGPPAALSPAARARAR